MSVETTASKGNEQMRGSVRTGCWTMVCDRDGALATAEFSHGFRALLGYADETEFPDRLESWTGAVHPDDLAALEAARGRLLAAADGTPGWEADYRMRTRQGEWRLFHGVENAVRRDDGTVARLACVAVDVTDVQAAEALRRNLRNMGDAGELLHEVLPFGIWRAELDNEGVAKSVHWSDEFRHLLGFQSEADFPNTAEAWLSRLHPDDYEIASVQLVKLVKTSNGGFRYDDSYRLRTKNGAYRWFRAVAKMKRDKNGGGFSLLGVFIDVNDAHELAELQAAKQEQFDRIMSLANDFESIYDVNIDTGEYTLTNKNGIYTEDLLEHVKLGDEYFESSARNIRLAVYPKDQPEMLKIMDRKFILDKLAEQSELTQDYRLVIGGKPVWYRMKIVRWGAWPKDRRMLMGIFNNERVRKQEDERRTFSEMTTILGESYESIYYVDMSDNSYTEFDKRGGFGTLDLALTGEDFFTESQKNIEKAIHPDDRMMVSAFIERDHILRAIEHGEAVSTEYRILLDGRSVYYRMRVVKSHSSDEHVVIAVENVDDEVHERNEHQEKLAEALRLAQSANRAKTIFLNNMSHDIRTPMNAIIGFTGLAATHIDNKEQVQDYLRKIGQSSNHLLSLINDVLDMSRIESGKMNLNEQEESLAEILHTLRDIILTDVNAKQLELFIDTVDVRNEKVVCDKLRLNQVLFNIMSNAVKYTAPGGTISMRIKQKAMTNRGYGSYEFHIKDTGIGMSPEYVKTIFEPFTRERSSTVSGIQGTGLGMAITKNIVDMMGGKIDVVSKQGEGTEFIVTLDFKLASDKEAPEDFGIKELEGLRGLVVDDDSNTCLSISRMLRDTGMRPEWCVSGKEAVIRTQEAMQIGDLYTVYIIDWLMPDMNGIETTRRIRRIVGDKTPIIILTAYDWSDIEAEAREAGVTGFVSKPMFPSDLRKALLQFCGTLHQAEEKAAAERGFTGRRLLLVEDNELNREIATELLTENGFEVDQAEDGSIAVEKIKAAKEGDYDLILMDVQMPLMNGYQATRAIRSLPGGKEIPIIALSANAFEEDRQKSLEAGMNAHIAKPIKVKELFDTLRKFL